jgi:hypothetical protein
MDGVVLFFSYQPALDRASQVLKLQVLKLQALKLQVLKWQVLKWQRVLKLAAAWQRASGTASQQIESDNQWLTLLNRLPRLTPIGFGG